MKINKLHKFALQASLLVILMLLVLYASYIFLDDHHRSKPLLFLFILLAFFFSYLIYYYLLRYQIRKEFKRIFKPFDIESQELLESNDTNMETLLQHVEDFVKNKHREIEQLHNRDDFRKEFLGNVSHELKTPLFTAQGYILTLIDGALDDPEMRQKYLDKANKSIDRLNFIVKDLDMISRLESGMNLDYESFNIVKLVMDVFDILDIQAGKKNIQLKFDKVYDFPILVSADKERIEQVLINLISNSINYGKIGGETTVAIKSYDEERFLVEIKDDGIGIKQADISRLFERFYRVDKSRSRENGGSGLGLAIVKHIIEAHKQEVFVKSTPGIGAAFSFTLLRVV